MIEGFKHGASVGQLSKAIETHGVQPLEAVAVLPMPRGTAMLLDETLISSNPAMTRSSRGVRLDSLFVSTSTPSSSRRASSSSVNLGTRSLRPHTGQEGHALGHALFPSVERCNRGQPATLLPEFQGPLGR